MRVAPFFLVLGVAACSSSSGKLSPRADAGSSDSSAKRDIEAREASPAGPPDGSLPSHPKSLPFSYTRPENGTPISQAEIDAKTDELIDLLAQTHYFGFVDERVHGWPESDPQARYWYGNWWSGVDVHVQSGAVTYFHGPGGSDNDGISTSPVLEGACFAHLLWPNSRIEHLERRLIRGFSSWILAMERESNDPDTLLTRAQYPVSIASTDPNVSYFIDYSQNRPGIDNGATDYVHIPKNPFWGDLYVKNKRSKDDIGHMFRAIAQIDACDGTFTEAGAEDDLVELRKLYQLWSRSVEAAGWAIPTLDKSDALWIPPDELAHFTLIGSPPLECTGQLALRLFGHVTPGGIACGDGISSDDALATEAGHSNGQIYRSFHEAGASHALLSNNVSIARSLLGGLAKRLDDMLDAIAAGMPPPFVATTDTSDLILFSANAGVPLTWREVAFLHQQIDLAHMTYLATSNMVVYQTFAPATPDGSYLFEPTGDGLGWGSIGALLGQCTSEWRNPASKPVLNCAKLKAWAPVF